jgi:hypothetical protein
VCGQKLALLLVVHFSFRAALPAAYTHVVAPRVKPNDHKDPCLSPLMRLLSFYNPATSREPFVLVARLIETYSHLHCGRR